jgi:hypothetical protein
MVPSTIAIPRDGSFALAFLGRVRRVRDPIFSVALGRDNLALKRIVGLVSCNFMLQLFGPTCDFSFSTSFFNSDAWLIAIIERMNPIM